MPDAVWAFPQLSHKCFDLSIAGDWKCTISLPLNSLLNLKVIVLPFDEWST